MRVDMGLVDNAVIATFRNGSFPIFDYVQIEDGKWTAKALRAACGFQ